MDSTPSEIHVEISFTHFFSFWDFDDFVIFAYFTRVAGSAQWLMTSQSRTEYLSQNLILLCFFYTQIWLKI